MSGTNGNRNCFICRKQAGKEEQPPGGYLYKGRHFAVCHAPLNMGLCGTILVESRRHFLDFGDMKQIEGVEFIEILRRLFPAIKLAADAERIYSVAMMDGAPHFHLWLVPWRKGELLRGVKYLASGQTPPSPKDVEEVTRKIEKRLQRDLR